MGELVVVAKQFGGGRHVVGFGIDSVGGDCCRGVVERPIWGGWQVVLVVGALW